MSKKNDKKGFCLHFNKVCWYSYTNDDGGVFRADGRCVGNHVAGCFRLSLEEWVAVGKYMPNEGEDVDISYDDDVSVAYATGQGTEFRFCCSAKVAKATHWKSRPQPFKQ